MSIAARDVEVSRKALLFGLLGGAVAWTAHLIFAYGVAEFGCVARLGEQDYLGISTVAWLELALTVGTTMAAAAATVVAYRSHRRLPSAEAEEDPRVASERHIAWAGLLTSGMFTFIILFESIPILYYLHDC